MRNFSLFSPPTWNVVEEFVREEINKKSYATDLGVPYTSFITRERLEPIWNAQIPHHGPAYTPFKALCRHTTRDLTFPKFCENLIRLCSALAFVGWDRLATKDGDCEVRGALDNQARIGVRNRIGEWTDLSDTNLPLNDEHIALLFGARHNRHAFRDSQYLFCPIVIIAGTRRPTEHPLGTRIPFESVKSSTDRKGWYGNVDEVKIVEGYMKWERPEDGTGSERMPTVNKVFACKTFRVRENFFSEHDKLVTLDTNEMRHNHIMMHIAAFVVDDQFKIIFPWAWADLNHFCGMDPREYPPWLTLNAVSPYNVFREAHSLGQALEFLHHSLSSWDHGPRSLFHMDLKSDNILVMSPHVSQLHRHPLGIWKITDFGLSDFGISRSDSEVRFTMIGDVVQSIESSGSRPIRHVGPFQAPEAEKEGRSRVIDQAKADVWSFGCVLAELLAFSALGPTGFGCLRSCLDDRRPDVDRIYRKSYFYTCSDTGVFSLVPALNEFLSRPYADDAGSNDWFSTMWQFISTTALSITPQARPNVRDFCESLRRLVMVTSTPHRCMFQDKHHVTGFNVPGPGSGEGSVRSEPVAQVERSSPSEEPPTRSSSGPPRSPPSTPSRTRRTLPLRVSTNDDITETGQYFSPSSPITHDGSPLSPRQSGSISTVLSSPLQLSNSSPIPYTNAVNSINFAGQLNSLNIKSEFVILSSDGTTVIFSDGTHLTWSQVSLESSLLLRECELPANAHMSLGSIQPTMLSILVKCDNRRLIRQSVSDDAASTTTIPLNHVTKQREIRAICISSVQCLAVEFVQTIEVFDPNGRPLLAHQKDRRDLILDLAFDQTGEYLFAISAELYWIWRRNDSAPFNYAWAGRHDHSLRGCTVGFQRPKILTLRGSANFLIQDIDLKDGIVRVAVIDEGGPRKVTITSSDGSIKSPLCLTANCQDLFAVILPNSRRTSFAQEPSCYLERWRVLTSPRIVIQPRSAWTRGAQFPISRNSFSKLGRLSTASMRANQQNWALVAQFDGRLHRLLLESNLDRAISAS